MQRNPIFLRFFRGGGGGGVRTSSAKKNYIFVIFQGAWGGRGSGPLVPPLDLPMATKELTGTCMLLILSLLAATCRLLLTFANSLTQIRIKRTGVLIGIQTICHSDSVPERFF